MYRMDFSEAVGYGDSRASGEYYASAQGQGAAAGRREYWERVRRDRIGQKQEWEIEEDTVMEMKAFIHESLIKLQELGIDVLAKEPVIGSGILNLPQEVLEAMEEEQILGMVLSSAGYILQRRKDPAMYVFDLEVSDIQQTYEDFLQGVAGMAKGELVFTDITQEAAQEDLESGQGMQTVRFQCNRIACEYKAKLHYDWFDTGIFAYVNQVLKEQNRNSRIYVASDGRQDCIVWYRTEEWAQRFYELFGMRLICP